MADLSHKDEIKPSHFFGFGYSYSVQLDKWNIQEQAADYVFIGDHTLSFEKPGALGIVVSFDTWKKNYNLTPGIHPLIKTSELSDMDEKTMCFVEITETNELRNLKLTNTQCVLVFNAQCTNRVQIYRYWFKYLISNNIHNSVILKNTNNNLDSETFQLEVSSELGALMIDGLGDGIWIKGKQPSTFINSTSFGILQATRTRISKTEYISCPSCGRTLFDLQETTAKIRKETDHLKGLKIGIMGCIVNGPGEMADADYGYVGTGPGKITLYKEKTVIKKNVPEEEAVQELIELIKSNGDWADPI